VAASVPEQVFVQQELWKFGSAVQGEKQVWLVRAVGPVAEMLPVTLPGQLLSLV
jgi:hypothetical protein